MLSGLITIAGGILAASSLIIARKPNAKELIDKLTPYQGWIGFVMFFWGAWEILGVVRSLGLFGTAPMHMAFWLAVGVIDLCIGLILGFGLISKYALNKNEVARAKGQELRAKLVNIQVPLGFAAIISGALYIVM